MPETTFRDRDSPGGFSHLPALDGVRGLAILLVLANHLLPLNEQPGSWVLQALFPFREMSWVGVNLFFALSGFLITGILRRSLDSGRFFTNFYARRVLRIFPLYYGCLLALLAMGAALHFSWHGWQYLYLTYTANLALWPHQLPDLGKFRVTHFWSLQVEEQFYFLWPLIVYRVRDASRLIRICACGCLLAPALRIVVIGAHLGDSIDIAYTFTPCCADSLLFGCALALLVQTERRRSIEQFAHWVLAICVVAIYVERILDRGFLWTTGFFIPTVGLTLIGMGSASLIAMTLRAGSTTQRLFSLSPLRFFGKYSYGIYIFHQSINSFLAEPLRQFCSRNVPSHFAGILLTACVVGCSALLAALLSYHLYEVHFLKLKTYFGYGEVAKA